MKNHVTYEKPMRERAIADRKGLYSLDLIRSSKTPGKLGSRITLQGPVSLEEQEMIGEFIVKLLEFREAKYGK